MTSDPTLQNQAAGRGAINRVSFNEMAARKQDASQQTMMKRGSSMSGSAQDTSSRLSQLGRALKRLLDPNQDRLLPGYAELIQLQKATTVAAREERKEEERRYYEAQIARFNIDRRQHIKKDDNIRSFLLQKKADIYDIIEANMRKLKVFPENHSLIDKMTADEKVKKIQLSLRNQQLDLLAKYVQNARRDSFIPSHLSPSSRKKMIQARQRERHASQEAALREQQASEDAMASLRKNMSVQQALHEQYVRETRDLQLSDLATVLEDLEVIELETEISKQEFNVPGANRKDDEAISKNKQMLDRILERPSLSELFQRSIEKNDVEAARKAELKFKFMQRHSLNNLAKRVNLIIGVDPKEANDGARSLSPLDAANKRQTQSHANQYEISQDTSSQFDISPSRRALNNLNKMVTTKISPNSKYVPAEQLLPNRRFKNLEESIAVEDSYRYSTIEAILQSASSQFRFADDIDNSEEEELTDDELRDRIKERKDKEKSRRDDLTTVKTAALMTASSVEAVRKKIGVCSIVTSGINLEALKQRQAKLRKKIDESDAPITLSRIQAEHDVIHGEASLGKNFSFKRLMQAGYEPCEEEEDVQSSSDASVDSMGRQKAKAQLDPVAALERQMKKFATCDTDTPDTLDLEKLKQMQFKASFISHLCAVKERQSLYKQRLRNFDHRKSTKGNVVNQPYHEKRIYQSIHRVESSKSIHAEQQQTLTSQVPSSIHIETVQAQVIQNRRSQSSFTTQSANLSMSKNPTLTQMQAGDRSTTNERVTSVMNKCAPGAAGAAPFNQSSAINVIQQTHSHPALGSPSASRPAQKLMGSHVNRGLDLSCVNSSNLAMTPSPHQIVAVNDIIQNIHNSQQISEEMQRQLASANSASDMVEASAEPIAQNQFSTLSLRIVLSPRGPGLHEFKNNSPKLSPNVSKSIQKRVVPKNQESTVTVLGKTAMLVASNEATNESEALDKDHVRESAINMQALYQRATSRSLLGTRSSASQQALDQKLQASGENQTSIMQKSVAHLAMLNSGNVFMDDSNIFRSNTHASAHNIQNTEQRKPVEQKRLQNASPGSQQKLPGANTLSQPIDTKSNDKEKQLQQQLITPSVSNQASKSILNKNMQLQSNESPTASKLNMVELPQQPITQISFEKSGQNALVAASRDQLPTSNVAIAGSKVTTKTMNSPRFAVSPRAEATNTQMDSLAKQTSREDGNDLAAMYEQNAGQKTTVITEKGVLATTNFDFPLPVQADAEDHRGSFFSMDSQQRMNFKQKMIRRFGGTMSYWQGQHNAQIKQMTRTFQDFGTADRQDDYEATGPAQDKVNHMNIQSNEQTQRATGRNPSVRKSIVAQEVSLGSEKKIHAKTKKEASQSRNATNKAVITNHTILEEALRARTNLLGPTEYLQLSSGATSNTPERVRNKCHVVVQDSSGTLTGKNRNGSQMKNVVKLELNQRQDNSKLTNKSALGANNKSTALKNRITMTADSKDDKSDMVDGPDHIARLQPVMIENNSIGTLARIAIQEDKAPDEVTRPIQARIETRKRSVDSNQMVETQGLASHLHLHDAATSPVQILTKPNSPEQVTPQDLPLHAADLRKGPMKGLSHMGLNRLMERLDTTTQHFNSPVVANSPQYQTAGNMRKLSISILTTDLKNHERELQKQSALRISPSNNNKNSAAIFGALQSDKVQAAQIYNHFGRNELTPHLQSTNVKIALQKERSKRMIQLLSKKNSGQLSGKTEHQLKHGASQSIDNLNQKQSSPFLSPRQIDLGLNLDQDFKISQLNKQNNMRATQEYKANGVTMVNKGTSNMSNQFNTGGSTDLTGDLSKVQAHAGEFAMDSQGKFVKVIKRNSSQPENPLLNCSDEDENEEAEHLKIQKLMSVPYSTDSKRLVTLVGNSEEKQILSDPQQMISGSQSFQRPHEMRQNTAGQTYQSLAEQSNELSNPLDAAYRSRMMNQTLTPSQPQERLAMGLGGEDIITDGASQIRIEQDIKEMQGLLPPLLETASTKQFFKNDEIRLSGEDQKKQLRAHQQFYNIQNESIPLQYIRDTSKMSEHKTSGGIEIQRGLMNKSKYIKQQTQLRLKGERSPGSNTVFNQNEMLTTGIQYSPTPLSVLQENPLQSDLANQNRFRRSVHGSKVSISVVKKQKSARNSQVVNNGPYLKSFTQRIKLPNLNRSQYASLGRTHENAHAHQNEVTHHRRSNARSSVVTKHNNVFTTKDSDLAHGETSMTKHIANNFRVKIKNQLNQSFERSLHKTHYGVMDGQNQKFIDLHQSARNSGSFGMQVSTVGNEQSSGKQRDSYEKHNRLKSQILVYGGGQYQTVDHAHTSQHLAKQNPMMKTGLTLGSPVGRNYNHQPHATNTYMHQTLTQVLMPPIDANAPAIKKSLPPKSLLFKNAQKAQQNNSMLNNAGSKTSRSRLKQPSELASYNALQSAKNGVGRASPGRSPSEEMNAIGGVKTGQGKIESGSMELSPQKKVQLAADIHESLVPITYPLMDGKKSPVAGARLSETCDERDHKKDASTRVKLGSINPDQTLSSIANLDKEAYQQSQGSSLEGGKMSIPEDSVTGMPPPAVTENGETRRQSVEDGQVPLKELMTQSQESQETLSLAKNSSIVEVTSQNKKGLKIHMFDESSQVSPQKTANDWNKATATLVKTSGEPLLMTKEEDSQTNFQEVSSPLKPLQQFMQAMEGIIMEDGDQFSGQDSAVHQQHNQLQMNTDEHKVTHSDQLYSEEDELMISAKQLNNVKPHNVSIQSAIDAPAAGQQHMTKVQELMQEHEMTMYAYRQLQAEQSVIERFYTRQPISYTGQKDITNSVWVDTQQYAAKKRPDLMLADLKQTTRNGKVEAGLSPFDKQDFIRMDGQTVKISSAPAQPTKLKPQNKAK